MSQPLEETAGLIIGDHRAGTGRNFDGMIDEVALWSRTLTAAEVLEIHHSGTPQALPTGVSAADTDGDRQDARSTLAPLPAVGNTSGG